MAKNIGYLKQCGVFRHTPLGQLDGLERRCRMRNVPRGKLVYSPGDAANAVYLLASGRIKICALTAEGKQAILMFVDPGELFGELAILETGMREDMAEACEDACVIGIPVDALQQSMEADAETGLAMVRMIAARRRWLERRRRGLLFRSHRERLILALLDLSQQYGSCTRDGLRLSARLSHQDLANMIGSSRETVTIALANLRSAGHVRVQRRNIVLTRPDELARSVGAAAAFAHRCGDRRCGTKGIISNRVF